MTRYAIVLLSDETEDVGGQIIVENLSHAEAMQRAADLNAAAPSGTFYRIERF